jgi:hypothetical protein
MMKAIKKMMILAAGILFVSSAYAQESQKDIDMKTFFKVDGGVSGLGVSLETPLSNKFLFEIESGLGAGYDIDTRSFRYSWVINDPAIYTSVRGKYYYNRELRAEKGKNIFMNSGNFIGVRIKFASSGIISGNNYNTLLTNVHWGAQRQLNKHWMYSFYAGLGYAYDTTYSGGTLYPAIDIKFSYVLPLLGNK